MARTHGKNSVFTIADSGAVVRDISTFLTSVDGLPGDADVAETTGLGVEDKTYISGLGDAKIALKGLWDDTATSGPDVVLAGLLNSKAIVAFVYAPKGTTAGSRKYSGSCICMSYKASSPVNGVVTFTADFQKTGALAISTY